MKSIELIHGDCLVEMKNIPDKSVNCVICDPPYGIDYQGRAKIRKFAKIANDKVPFTGFIDELPRILKDDGCAFIFTRWDVQEMFISQIEEIGGNSFKLRSIIIWNKMVHSIGNLTQEYGRTYESILFATMKNFAFPRKRPVDIISVPRVSSDKLVHPNEKPIALLGMLLTQTTRRGDVILDPTMGSGSTGVACVNINRKFIGIELDGKYFNIAQKRIHDCKIQQTLFDYGIYGE